MNAKREEAANLIREIECKPGGKQAVRALLNSASGLIPFAGGVFSAASSTWSEIEQDKINEKLIDWIITANDDISEIARIFNSQFASPTKSAMAILIGEILGSNAATHLISQNLPKTLVALHSLSIEEFQPYVKLGWIQITPNSSTIQMGSGNSIGNLYEDKKRGYGLGSGVYLQVNKKYFDE